MGSQGQCGGEAERKHINFERGGCRTLPPSPGTTSPTTYVFVIVWDSFPDVVPNGAKRHQKLFVFVFKRLNVFHICFVQVSVYCFRSQVFELHVLIRHRYKLERLCTLCPGKFVCGLCAETCYVTMQIRAFELIFLCLASGCDSGSNFVSRLSGAAWDRVSRTSRPGCRRIL
jgi:hypothetical protein